ncbi:CapA family protein [Actinomadura viridis]|uniref:Poly-gamma-glutamate synthesis protein (Capsule biosynthesis protein) n=1 Tax=Actinomadura viridis TaxID=58110 RepID=A0A931DPQ5_9ACTN|nr:CapA family protein [Actinomadura viridis]MBG6092499.1 poly-gamma-glutamate synthesis protein (capsule biosynthesis protein) [Actinomadura viridis]
MGERRRTGRSAAMAVGLALVTGTALLAAGAAVTVASGGGGTGGGEKAVPKRPFTVAFGGDVHFEGMLRSRLDAAPDTALGPVAERLGRADLAMVNLETAVTTGGVQAPKQFAFRAPPAAFRALRSAGVDVATMANNHGMDFGEPGLRDSLAAARRAGMPVVGIGRNAAEAYKPYTVTVKGAKVAIIGATQVLDDHLIQAWTATDAKAGLASAKNAPRLVQEVRAARKAADVVIVNLHWGQELNSCATPVQRGLAAQLADAGADAVVGSHAHVLQAGGYLKGAYVHYGLGNFVFYNSGGRTAQSGVLTLTFDPGRAGGRVSRAHWAPAMITGGVPRPLTGAAEQQARSRWEALRTCADVRPDPA